MLVITVWSCAGQPKFAVNFRVEVDAFGAVGASWEVFALLSGVKKGTILLVTFGEVTTFDLFVFDFILVSLDLGF